MYFALPHVHITSLKSNNDISLNISLNSYIKSVESIIPNDSFFNIIDELLQLFDLKTDNSLHFGSSPEYFIHKKIDHCTSAKLNTTYSLILCDLDIKESYLNYQSLGGNSIFKIKDSTNSDTIQILYLLSACYETVYLCKPDIESPMSSVKYAVCCNFKKKYELSKLQIPYYFIIKLDDINSIFGHCQLENMCSRNLQEMK